MSSEKKNKESFEMALDVDGFSEQKYEVKMNEIHMSLDQESITISEGDDNIDETPMNHDVLNRMANNQSMIERQQINDPSKFIKGSSVHKRLTSQGGADMSVGGKDILSPATQTRKPEYDEDSLQLEKGDPTHREAITVQQPPSSARSDLKTKKSMFVKDKATDIAVGVKKKYTSRRSVVFEDNDSNGEEDGYNLSGTITYKDTQGNVTSIKPNPRFQKYSQIFTNLLKQNQIVTRFPIQNIIISYDSQRAVVVTQKDDQASYITQFSIQTTELTFEEKIGNEEGYIKVKECVQNSTGQQFACCYMDDGKFRMRIFGKEQRKRRQIHKEEVRFNEIFGLDDYSMSIDIFPDPFITCCFTTDDLIFVSFFHTYSLTHYHFLWDIAKRKVIGIPQFDEHGIQLPDKPVTRDMSNTSMKNFPYKCFYSAERNEIYCIYRQGEVYTIKPDKLNDYRFQKIIDRDLGQMELLFDQALCIRSSSKVLFFKQVWNDLTEIMEWQLYNSIDVRGFIYFIRGNVRIQITTDQLIYFYLIDPETFEPSLENVMYNYMMCNQMMIGAKKRYSITYKQNERSFDIYQRKYMHNLRVCVDDFNYEGSKAIELPSANLVLISKIDQVIMLDNQYFTKCGEIPITLLQTETREPNEVIGIQKSKDENWVAIISGKNLIMSEQKQNQLFIFKRKKGKAAYEYDSFEQTNRIVVKDLPIFERVCMNYHFKNTKGGADPDTIIFAKPDIIFELNFVTSEIKTIVKFEVSLIVQPLFFEVDPDQEVFTIASALDGIYINMKKNQYIDLDELYGIDQIRSVIYDIEDEEFYILVNCKSEKIGFYLLKYPKEDPTKSVYLTQWQHNLDIGDANLYISRGSQDGVGYKELICGYKTIGINTYNTVVLDISSQCAKGRQTLQRHEAFQLWESPVSGLLLEHSKDFLTFSKAGINILALGTQDKKPLKDQFGMDMMMHSLDSLSYLKVDSINYINFRCQDYENRVMSIEQEWSQMGSNGANSTFYDEIYKIKIHEVTLRELLILQSFYVSRTTSDIIKLIKMQPDPRFFYKTFLELGGANFCSILSFDSYSMESLLSEDNEQYFSEEYPIIYKNKMLKKDGKGYYYTNAIENALKNNQVKAVNLLIAYIVKYQNNYVSSYMFLKNLPILMDKGIALHDLLDSKVFNVVFDYDAWPGNHNDDEECIRAYSGSFFDIRQSYNEIFSDFVPIEDQDESEKSSDDAKKVSKIKYSINLLAQVSMYMTQDKNGQIVYHNDDISLMSLCGETEEMEIFETDAIQQVIQFKWDKYGRNHHLLGCVMHLFYTFILIVYVKQSYLVENEDQLVYAILIAIGILYPWIYDMTQMARGGLVEYLSDPQNYADLLYIYGSIANIVVQLYLGPFHIASKILMCFIVLLLISKTFFFLRIFPVLTPIVVMITNVIYDLRIFLLFYLILIALFCQIFAVLGLGNQFQIDEKPEGFKSSVVPGGPAQEYQAVGLHIGEFLWTFRLSLGDFSAVGATGDLSKIEMQVFWVMWMMTVIVTCIIFLNFVVAEACASYSKVVESLESIIQQAQAVLIAESEEMTLKRFQTKDKYPRYLVYRGTEN